MAVWSVSKRSWSKLNSLYSMQAMASRDAVDCQEVYVLLLVSSALDVLRAQGGKKQ